MSSTPQNPKKERKNSNAYLKYSGMVGQLIFLLFFAAYIGQWLDEKMNNDKPLVTAALLILALVAYLFKLSIDLKHDS